MEELLIRLGENERLMESLEVDSTATGKAGGAKTSDTKGKQSMANPAIHQKPSAHSAEVNTMSHSVLKRKHDPRTKPSSGVINYRVLRDHRGTEISNLINDQPQKHQEMMTLDATFVSHLDEINI